MYLRWMPPSDGQRMEKFTFSLVDFIGGILHLHLIYIHNYDKHYYPFCKSKLFVESLNTSRMHISIKIKQLVRTNVWPPTE